MTSKDKKFNLADAPYELRRCEKCGLIYLSPRPREATIGLYYPEEYLREGKITKETGSFGKVLVSIYHVLIARGAMRVKGKSIERVLDVGCGVGNTLEIFRRYGCSIYGLDTNLHAIELARHRFPDGKFFNCKIRESSFPPSFFDIVIMRHVLEHLHFPLQDLRTIRRILKDGGILAVTVPNINCVYFKIFKDNWLPLEIPRHLLHFSPFTLKVLLEEAGFEIAKSDLSFEDPLDWFNGISRVLGIESRPVSKLTASLLILIGLLGLPLALFLSGFQRGTIIQYYFRPKGELRTL